MPRAFSMYSSSASFLEDVCQINKSLPLVSKILIWQFIEKFVDMDAFLNHL